MMSAVSSHVPYDLYLSPEIFKGNRKDIENIIERIIESQRKTERGEPQLTAFYSQF